MSEASSASSTVSQVAQSCARCGYQLTGLVLDGHCPECGLGVERSIALGKELQNSRPGWIKSIGWAARLGLWCYLAFTGSILAAIMMAGSPYAALFMPAAAIVVGLCRLAEIVLLWQRENPHAKRQLPLIRLTFLTGFTFIQLAVVVTATVLLLGNRINQPDGLALLAASMTPFALSSSFEFSILHRFSRRALDPRLIEHTSIVGIGLTLSLVLGGLLMGSSFVFDSQSGENPSGWVQIALPLIGLGVTVLLLLFWIWAVYVLWFLSRMLFAAAHRARIAWNDADAATQNPATLPQR